MGSWTSLLQTRAAPSLPPSSRQPRPSHTPYNSFPFLTPAQVSEIIDAAAAADAPPSSPTGGSGGSGGPSIKVVVVVCHLIAS